MEEMKIIAEQERNERLAERQRKIDAGELIEDEDEDEAAKKGFIKNLEFFCDDYFVCTEMEQAILDDRNYEPKKEDFIDKIPETIPEGDFMFLIIRKEFLGFIFSEDESVSKEPEKDKASSMYYLNTFSLIKPLNKKFLQVLTSTVVHHRYPQYHLIKKLYHQLVLNEIHLFKKLVMI